MTPAETQDLEALRLKIRTTRQQFNQLLDALEAEDGAVTESEMDEIKARAGVAREELDQLIGAVEGEHERSVDRVADRRPVGRRVGVA